jgi:3-methyladenine DNA glycosylase/8-oxoguanine DNA glycosylase
MPRSVAAYLVDVLEACDAIELFALRRPDAWPSGDLALAKAVQELWGLPAQPGWDELDACVVHRP